MNTSRARLVEKIKEEGGRIPSTWNTLIDINIANGKPVQRIYQILEMAIIAVPPPSSPTQEHSKFFMDDYQALWEKVAMILGQETSENVRKLYLRLRDNDKVSGNAFFYVAWSHVERVRGGMEFAREVLMDGLECNAQPRVQIEFALKKLEQDLGKKKENVPPQPTLSGNPGAPLPLEVENIFPLKIDHGVPKRPFREITPNSGIPEFPQPGIITSKKKIHENIFPPHTNPQLPEIFHHEKKMETTTELEFPRNFQKMTWKIPLEEEFFLFGNKMFISNWKELVLFVNSRPYYKLALAGKGGSSKVFKVLGGDGNVYAIKQVILDDVDDSNKLQQFLEEVKLLEKLKNSEHIITLHDMEHREETLYIVLEYGEIDLDRLLAQHKGGILNDKNRLRLYWQQMLEAVSVIHENRIVHGDLKPHNFVFVGGFLKLIDFGIAKAIKGNTTNIQRVNLAGTMNYLAPETLFSMENGRPSKCSRKADIWSLGCILYQMVYGKTPFANEGIGSLLGIIKFLAIQDKKFRLPAINGVPLPQQLMDVISCCLEKEPAKRPTIKDLLSHPFLYPT